MLVYPSHGPMATGIKREHPMESSAGSSSDPASSAANSAVPPSPVASFDDPANPATSASMAGLASTANPGNPANEWVATDGWPVKAGRWPRRLFRRRRPAGRAARPMTGKKAGVVLTGLAVLAVAFVSTTAVLANRALSAARVGTSASTAPLIMPAPAQAAGLPRHYLLSTSQDALPVIAQFRQRFAVLRDESAAHYPEGLYGEPGRIDATTDSAGWVMYLGYNSRASLGDPARTTRRLMAVLAGQASVRSWQVPARAEDVIARCMVALVGSTRMSVCGWATSQTVAAVMSPTAVTSTNELAALMPLMRLDLQPSLRHTTLRQGRDCLHVRGKDANFRTTCSMRS